MNEPLIVHIVDADGQRRRAFWVPTAAAPAAGTARGAPPQPRRPAAAWLPIFARPARG